MDSGQFVVNRRHVVHETIDDETILIHLGTGVYYSLDASGTEIWSLASQGVHPDDVVAGVQAAHPAHTPARIDADVKALFERLVEEELLVEGTPERLPDIVLAPGSGNGFATPLLQKYTDMQDFMLVDPLHEVDQQAGWPHVSAG